MSRVLALGLLVIFAGTAVASAAFPTLQLGALPFEEDVRPWAIAAPLGEGVTEVKLESGDDRLSLMQTDDGMTWVVLEARRPGPISGVLHFEDASGNTVHRAVAGECVAASRDAPLRLLIVERDGSAPLRRLLRTPKGARSLSNETRAQQLPAPDRDGWQMLRVPAPVGTTEARASLVLADGSRMPVQISLLESITTLATASLPQGWEYRRMVPVRERLRGRALDARLALVGVRAGARALRIYRATTGTSGREARLARLRTIGLPAIDPTRPSAMARLRVSDPAFPLFGRQPYLLRLAGEDAMLLDPRTGIVAESTAPGLRFTGAMVRSSLRKHRLFAVRRDARSGQRYLRRWWARRDAGEAKVRGRLFRVPLNEEVGLRSLRALDLRSWTRDARWPELPVRESLLMLASPSGLGRGGLPLRVYELQPRRDGSGRLASVQRRFTSALAPPAGALATAKMDWLRTPTVGSRGFPRFLQITDPTLRARELVRLDGVGSRLTRVSYVQSTDQSVGSDGYDLDPVVFFHTGFDGKSSTVRRQILANGELQTMARGTIAGRRLLRWMVSARGRYGYALTDDGVGGTDARYDLRLRSSGLRAGTNLPPRVDAGADISTVATGRDGALVRLRARAMDANGDPLEVRWSAPGVRFADPLARVTEARFPRGRTQVRVRAREVVQTAGKKRAGQPAYQSADVVEVNVSPATAVDPPESFVTALSGIYPNPGNPRVRVAFTVGRREHLEIRIYDVAGRLVRRLIDDVRGPGAYDEIWDGTDDRGRAASSGVYRVRLISDSKTETRTAVIVR